MSTSEGRASKAQWCVSRYRDSYLEVRRYQYGRCDGIVQSKRGYDSIWVVVDRLTKLAHFIPVKTTYQADDLAKLYLKEIVSLHGAPKSIISDMGTQFTSHYWRSF